MIGFAALLGAGELWRVLGSPSAEATRKLVHLGSGAACLALPFIIRSPWVVLAMAVSMSLVLTASQRLRLLPSLHAVERRSRGSEYYPIAVFSLYLLTMGRPALYVSAVLVLAIGDACAALVGIKYGRIHYEVEDSQKSVEGSVMFLLVAFLAIHLPLLLMTDLPREHAVLSALLVAALVTMFEAISLHGADNLFIPLGVAIFLDKIIDKPVAEAVYQNLSLVAVFGVVMVVTRSFGWFNTGARLMVVLYAYGAWALASYLWSLPVLMALVVSVLVGMRARRQVGVVKVRYLAGVSLPPFVFLALGNGLNVWASGRGHPPIWQDFMFGPYLASLAAVIGFWIRAHSRHFQDGGPAWAICAVAAAAWMTVILVPWILSSPVPTASVAAVFVATALVQLAEAAYTRVRALPIQPRRWTARRFIFTLIAGLLVAGAQHLGWIGSWQPSAAADPQHLFWSGPGSP